MRFFYSPKTFDSIRVAFINLFKGMYVIKYNKSGVAIQNIDVPIQFGPIDKAQADRLENHYYDVDNVEHNERFYLTLPRMAITMDGVTYDPDRSYGANEFRYFSSDDLVDRDFMNDLSNDIQDLQPTPYNISFTLHIRSNSIIYTEQLLENILPYFNPSISIRVKEFSFLNVERDLQVILNNILFNYSDDMNNEDEKHADCTINFEVKAFLYRKWVESKVIKYINTKYYVVEGDKNVLAEGINTSGLETSAGEVIETSAIPSDYIESGSYDNGSKEFVWYKGQLEIGE